MVDALSEGDNKTQQPVDMYPRRAFRIKTGTAHGRFTNSVPSLTLQLNVLDHAADVADVRLLVVVELDDLRRLLGHRPGEVDLAELVVLNVHGDLEGKEELYRACPTDRVF